MPIRRTFFQELEISWRHEGGHLTCSFVTLSGVEMGTNQRTIIASRHLSGSPERLVDETLQHVRELVLEHILSPEEPF